jgi:hypothetical protein
MPITRNALIRAQDGSVVKSQVVDVSPSGLRIRYAGKGLEAGSEVDVIYPLVDSRATVAWTVRSDQWIETGLHVTAEDKGETIDLVELLSIAVAPA